MATVAETELEQKTSEYFHYIKTFFESMGSEEYNSATTEIRFYDNVLTLQYAGK